MGDLGAVLIPPQERRFRTITGIGDLPVEPVFSGWNKHVLLAPERAFLFPRHHNNVEWLERELTVYDSVRVGPVPRVLGRWFDREVSPYPFAAVTRLHGQPCADLTPELAADLGRTIAAWHDCPAPPALRGLRLPAHLNHPHQQWLRRLLDPSTADEAILGAATRLDLDITPMKEVLHQAHRLDQVLVHGDVHEDQVLEDDGRVTGVLDWETARVDHPFWDFDLVEWGTGLWRRERHDVDRLWRVLWSAYAERRALDVDHRPMEVAFRLRQALRLSAQPDVEVREEMVGTLDEQLAAVNSLLV